MTQQPFDLLKQGEDLVKPEKTFWRDLKLLKRHRAWGWDCPAEDIDFMEYDNKKVIALFEYKRHIRNLEECRIPRAGEENYANITALIDLADRASLPVFITFYHQSGNWWFRTLPLNDIATNTKPPHGVISEYVYVDFLYSLRNRIIPEDVKQKLSGKNK